MPRFSANLGFLWTEFSLPDAIRAAAANGFLAVECHFPYDEDPGRVSAALEATGLPMLGLNTIRGNVEAGDFGLSALPGREDEAHAAIDQAVAYAARIGAGAVHVMAGKAEGAEAHACFLDNLRYARDAAAPQGIGVLIEPINQRDAPGYFLRTAEQAADIIAELGDGVRLMFDCYHTQITQGDLTRRAETHLPIIGHIQIAAAPSRAEPDEGEIAYERLIADIEAMGYRGYYGAEYRPRAGAEAGLAWMRAYAPGV